MVYERGDPPKEVQDQISEVLNPGPACSACSLAFPGQFVYLGLFHQVYSVNADIRSGSQEIVSWSSTKLDIVNVRGVSFAYRQVLLHVSTVMPSSSSPHTSTAENINAIRRAQQHTSAKITMHLC